jgi:flagellar hook protein FlgE
MSLTSALNTALTGMSAAETMIDVDGNNIANSNTVGFKASTATFATQFLQTQGLGSSPSPTNGGTNPRQIGMGTMVAEITPNFTQGTVEISSNPTDMAIQGDGFFIVQGSSGAQEYTRNGVFKMNSNNELVTSTGNRLLGFGIDQDYQIQSTQLQPIVIPLGTVAVAKATEVVSLQGTLTPSGDVATAAKIIQSGVLGDASFSRPDVKTDPPVLSISQQATMPPATLNPVVVPGPGGLTVDSYSYRVVFSDVPAPVPLTATMPPEGMPTTFTVPIQLIGGAGNPNAIDVPTVQLLATAGNPSNYKYVYIYRAQGNTTDFHFLASEDVATAAATDFTDDGSINNGAPPLATPTLNTDSLDGTYNYYIAYRDSNGRTSRPGDVMANISPTNGRVHITNLPPPPTDDPVEWKEIILYRNWTAGGTQFVQVTSLPVDQVLPDSVTYTDSTLNSVLQARAVADPNTILDFDGPVATGDTRVVDLIRNTNGTDYPHLFDGPGTLDFKGVKGGSTLAMKQFTITGNPEDPPTSGGTIVSDMLTFMTQSLGIQKGDAASPIPPSEDTVKNTKPPTYVDPGVTIDTEGIINVVSNNGTKNAIDISLDGLQYITETGRSTVNIPFTKYQDAIGESTMTDFLVYDSLGTACNVRITADLEREDDSGTVYRWFADSPSNSTTTGAPIISVGTGTITFDGKGKFVSASNDKVTIYRSGTPAVSPLVFTLDFLSISGLAEKSSSLQMKSQDGSPPGKLSSFIVGEDGLITGVFSNSIKRNLGQIRLARFANPAGLEQKGQNLFASGVNSGVPIEGNPGQQGVGSIIAGAVELSNTDIGGSLTDLILASTMYRGNARVITTTQQLFDELLALKR